VMARMAVAIDKTHGFHSKKSRKRIIKGSKAEVDTWQSL